MIEADGGGATGWRNVRAGSPVDVAVVGGGPAGSAVAIALARLGAAVVVLERTDGSGNPVGESLPPSATPLLHRLGAWEAAAATNPLAIHANRSCWGLEQIEERDALRAPYGPGWRVDRSAFNRALLGEAERAGATVLRASRVRAVEPDGSGWRLWLDHPRSLPARVLVDATGRPARIARWLGTRRRRFDPLLAVVAVLPPVAGADPATYSGRGRVRDGATLVEAVADGWWYSGLLPSGALVAACFADPAVVASSHAWRPDGWSARLRDAPATRERAQAFDPLAAVAGVTAAGMARLDRAAGAGANGGGAWLAVGDAAACHDPLTSHGIGSALHQGPHAAAAILAHLGGDRTALPAWSAGVAADHERCRAMLRAVYALESRWPDAPFWRARA